MPFQGYTMPPPSLGLDLVSPIDNMDPACALELTNIFPGAGAPTVRLGYEQFVDLATASGGVAGEIQFMKEMPLADGTSQLIVGQATQLFAIDESGVITNISKVGGYSSGYWDYELFADRIYLTNGIDTPQVYSGTGIAADITGSGVGLALTDLISVSSYRERLYFVEQQSMKMWYVDSPVGETFTAGAPVLKSRDFTYAMRNGGSLCFTGSYTNLANVTTDDLQYAISTEGEILLYQGKSPDDTEYKLVAHFFIGKPLGRSAFVNVNNDVWILTEQGVVPLSALFELDPEQAVNVVSQKINPLISAYAKITPFSNLWTGFYWPIGRRVYFTVPTSGTGCRFLVYSIDSKAWTLFALNQDTDCQSSDTFNTLPFYGSSTGIVWQGETGYADAKTSTYTGGAISYALRSAFSFYGSRGNFKHFVDIRPLLQAKRGTQVALGLDTDFKRQSVITTSTTSGGTFTPWGSPWGSPWSADVEYIYDRYSAKGQGHCAAIRFGGTLENSPLQIIGFEIRYDLGGQV
jgi:hypothetical protein